MGCNADVIVIGPYNVLRDAGCLDYDEKFYDDVAENDVVIGTVAVANTTDESQKLADICGVDLWDLGHHKVQWAEYKHAESFIGNDGSIKLAEALRYLLRQKETTVWFRPNG